ncbi:MAG TPA: hypothetical protein VJT13_23240 [Xanthobacteraceae bacterium]|nr:hypothetical protein [Xanthobacteraceae bacterium]
MALTLNLVLPVVATLVAGTGALATYATAPSAPRDATAPQTVALAPDPAPVSAPVSKAVPSPAAPAASPCDAQTWPYIDASCTKASADDRKVRLVTAPRSSDLPDGTARLHIPAPPNPNVKPVALPPGMISSDGVLRSPDIVVPPPKLSKREKRAEQRRERRERRFDARSYSVPSEASDRSTRAVMVVRPLRTDSFR